MLNLRNSLLLITGTVVFVLGGFEDTITFTIFTKDGNQFVSKFDDNMTELGCMPNEKYSIVIHGWLEDIDTEWVPQLIKNLQTYRSGCIIFMDYSNHSKVDDYFVLVGKYNLIAKVLMDKVYQLDSQGFDPSRLYMFGFSFGAQLAINTGLQYGFNRVDQIDVCDPAGPGFALAFNLVPTLAAKNVQCIHTSSFKGTNKRNCHQDWLMGRCGRIQEAAGPYPLGNHGLCPYFYNAAFAHDFYATDNIFRCPSRRIATNLPENFKMGYMEERKNQVFGDLFSPTGECYPYNNYTFYSLEKQKRRRPLARLRESRQEKLCT